MRNVTSGCDNGAPSRPWIMTMFQAERERMPVRRRRRRRRSLAFVRHSCIRSCNCYAPDIGRVEPCWKTRYPKKDSVKEELSFILEGGGGSFSPAQVPDIYIYIESRIFRFLDLITGSSRACFEKHGASFFTGRNRDARHGQCCNLT